MKQVIANGYKSGNYSSPEVIAQVISKSIQAKRPKIRYTAGKNASRTLFFRKCLSDRLMDKMIYRMMGNMGYEKR